MGATCEEMPCRDLVEVLTHYLEGALPRRDRELLEAHLRECPACVAYVEQFRATIEIAGRVGEESLSPRARTELLDAFRGWRGSERNARLRRRTQVT